MFFSLFSIWLVHAIIAAVLSIPIIILSYKCVHWNYWELLAFVLPFLIWLALMMSDLSNDKKSLGNLMEALIISLAVPLAAFVRALIGKREAEAVYAASILAALCAVAVAVFFLVPWLPE